MAAVGGSVARRYARALFGIGVDAGRFEELGRELDHAQRGREAAALDQLHVDPVEVEGKPIDILFERAAFIGDDRNRIRTADHLAVVRIR